MQIQTINFDLQMINTELQTCKVSLRLSQTGSCLLAYMGFIVNVYLVYISHYPDNSRTIHVIPIIGLLLPIEIRFILL